MAVLDVTTISVSSMKAHCMVENCLPILAPQLRYEPKFSGGRSMARGELTPQALLQPMLGHHDWSWTLHYPMYINTFCLAYHLATCLFEREKEGQGRANDAAVASIRSHLVRNEWWRGRPQFNYRADVEIFVGIDGTQAELNQEGHEIDDQDVVEFTRYDIKDLFLRKSRIPSVHDPDSKILLVTDVKTTAEAYLRGISEKPELWPADLGVFDRNKVDIKNSWERELSDVFAPNRKFYMFGAPMANILSRSAGEKESDKYIKLKANVPSIATSYIMRSNKPKNPKAGVAIRRAIENYYECVFDRDRSEQLIDDNLADAYARMAMTAGEANPFADLYSSKVKLGDGRLGKRYREILHRHHDAQRPS